MEWHWSFITCLFLLNLLSLNRTLDTKEFQKTLPAKVVWAVLGKDAELPCDITPPLATDNVSMIFWFKDGMGMPIYSLDARGGPISQASHLAMSEGLGARTYFIADQVPAKLRIQEVSIEDQGVFRCRVDFVNSPTRNFQVNLSLIVQPNIPRIFDAEGREIRKGSPAGPFLENHELFLSCQVSGGQPKPTLTWWHNQTLLDGVVDSSRASTVTVNQLTIRNLPRSMKGAKLQCRASSSSIAEDVVREVSINIYLKPSKVKIVSPNDLLPSHKSQDVRCETSGSYPPAKLTWLLDNKPLRNALVTEEETEGFTGSILSLTTTSEDDGKELVCRADNPRYPGGSIQDSRTIHVAFPPRVSVKLEHPSEGPFREGDDVTLRCETSARPSPLSYSWYQDGHLVPYNETAGVLPQDELLQLKNISKKTSGQYACSAQNPEGETYSAPYNLTIQFSPRCKKGHEIVRIGAMVGETLMVECHVDALPQVNRFSWTYNTSRGVFPIQTPTRGSDSDVSVLEFTPPGEEVESVSCWASNDVGRQTRPCLFYIVPAAPPESPRDCFLRNATRGGLEVVCSPGEDGGLHQNFVLELGEPTNPTAPPGVTTLSDQGERSLKPIYRVLGEQPLFRLQTLEPGREYHALIYAENAKGRSDPPVILTNIKLQPDYPEAAPGPENEPQEGSSRPGLTWVLLGLMLLVILLIVGIVTAAAVIACRKPKVKRRKRSSKPPSELELSEAGFGEGFHRRSQLYRASMYGETEERISRLIEGPDLILAPVGFPQEDQEY